MTPLGSLPSWLVVGVALGLVAALLVAAAFVVGGRLFPAPSATPKARGDGGQRSRSRTDGTSRRRAEYRDYLGRIGERFVEDRTVHGQTVAFYLPERDVAVTFDPGVFFGLEETDTRAVLCEHEMPGTALGRRLPFETADPEPTPDQSGVSAAYDRLGLSAEADPEAVESAYRERIKTAHPDNGGDEEAFKSVQSAYETAKRHAERRAS